MASPRHKWKFHRSGDVDQVVIADGQDLAHLDQLDQKLWIALACPTRGLEFDERTLDILDTDKDGRIRPPEIVAAVRWSREVFANLDDLFDSQASVPLASINQEQQAGKDVWAGARRILQNLGKADADSISLDDVADTARIFAATRFNGDGVVPVDCAESAEVRQALADIMAIQGSEIDRSGKPGVNQVLVDRFFDEATAYVAWLDKADGPASPRIAGSATAEAADAVAAVRAKVDDYFARCQLASFDSKAGPALNAGEADFAALNPRELTLESAEIARLPLARVEAGRSLPLVEGLNPAWTGKIATLARAAIAPVLGSDSSNDSLSLTEAQWAELKAKLGPFEAWMAARPEGKVSGLGEARVRELVAGPARQQIGELIAQDLAVKAESEQIDAVEKMIRFRRDLVNLLRNFVSFAEFYGRRRAIFQTGTLYLDGRSCDLCLPVDDAGKHAKVAGLARAYLVYCDCVRKSGEKRSIVAAMTGGDTDNLMVGRNGVFYDRKGNDWDATVTRIVENPISIRQAFWAPYRGFIRMVEEQVAKRASAADQKARAQVDAAALDTAHMDKTKAEEKKPDGPAAKVDVGTVAAIGVAVGGIATFLSSIIATFLGLGMWMPFGVVALLLAVSGPSMLIAWLKLRQRNVGPILDANGWAVNALAKINVPFGAALTQVARLPPGARRELRDPFAEKRRPWGLYLFLLVLLAVPALWFFGTLDTYLPGHLKPDTVLGRSSSRVQPAAQK
jgi:hypothetical protein